MELTVQTTHFTEHKEDFKDKTSGQRMVCLVDDESDPRGQLMWRVASGYTVEICEFWINREEDRRQGWGTRLMEAGLVDMRAFYTDLEHAHELLRVWLITEKVNEQARAFYKACGFEEATILSGFYSDGDAVLCVKDVSEGGDVP